MKMTPRSFSKIFTITNYTSQQVFRNADTISEWHPSIHLIASWVVQSEKRIFIHNKLHGLRREKENPLSHGSITNFYISTIREYFRMEIVLKLITVKRRTRKSYSRCHMLQKRFHQISVRCSSLRQHYSEEMPSLVRGAIAANFALGENTKSEIPMK